jgi:hypothetical protein
VSSCRSLSRFLFVVCVCAELSLNLSMIISVCVIMQFSENIDFWKYFNHGFNLILFVSLDVKAPWAVLSQPSQHGVVQPPYTHAGSGEREMSPHVVRHHQHHSSPGRHDGGQSLFVAQNC